MCRHASAGREEESAACEKEEARNADGQASVARGERASQGGGQDLGERIKGKGQPDEEWGGVEGRGGGRIGRVEGAEDGDEGKDEEVCHGGSGGDDEAEGGGGAGGWRRRGGEGSRHLDDDGDAG